MKRYGLIVILLVLFSLVMPSCSPEDSVYVNNDTPFGVRVVNPTPLTITGNVAVSAISGNTVVTLPFTSSDKQHRRGWPYLHYVQRLFCRSGRG
jgi:hypothetical protein